MDRNKYPRRPPLTNGISRRRHRTSPDHDMDGGDEDSGTVRMVPRNKRWKPADEVIGFSVPRKARSVSKRSSSTGATPSSSNVSDRKKMKTNGSVQITQKDLSSNPEELEIEIAEILYGLRTQSQVPFGKEANSSMISNSASSDPISVVVPKKKRQEQESKNLGISLATDESETDPPPKIEKMMPNSDKNPIIKSEMRNFAILETRANEFPVSSGSLEKNGQSDVAVVKVNSTSSVMDTQREEKFEIDLMAPPPQMRPSPERESDVNLVSVAADAEMKSMTSTRDTDEKADNSCRDDVLLVEEPEPKKARLVPEFDKSDKYTMTEERNIIPHLDLGKDERGNNSESLSGNNKSNPHVQKQEQPQLKVVKDQHPRSEKTAQASSLQMPMSLASWPGGLPPIRCIAPLQGVVSMDGSQVPPTPGQPLFSQPRPKRCGIHCYIAQNIHCLQQFMKMKPFCPAAAGSASFLYGAPIVQDKGQGLAVFPGHMGKEMDSQPASLADAQRKQQQILFQQTLPPGAPTNMLHGSAFIFPFNQQQATTAITAVSVRPGPAPNSSTVIASISASVNGSAAAAPTPAAVSIEYPIMPSNETQYLAVLQNNTYPFPIPASTFRGTHPQHMPFFYPSLMIHPSQLTGQQNASIPSGSSSSQAQQHINSFSAPKTRLPPQSSQPHQARNIETKVGNEDSPSTPNSRFSHPEEFFQLLNSSNYQVMQAAAVAQASQQRKNFKDSEEGKTGMVGDSSEVEKIKGSSPKPSVTGGQPIALMRPDSKDTSVSSANNQHGSRNSLSNSSPLQNLRFQQEFFQLRMKQMQKQQQQTQQQFVASRSNKTSPTSNGDHLATAPPSSASKLPNTTFVFSQNNAPSQSPRCKSSTRTDSQVQSPSTSSLKNVSQQQQPRPQQQSHTQISFGSGKKSQTVTHRQQQPPSTNNQSSLSPPLKVGSLTTSHSIGAAGGSTSTPSSKSQGNKASSVSSQQSKNPSILGNPHNIASSISSPKSLVQQQQYQQQMKQQMANHQPRLFFSSAYMQTQSPQSTSNASNTTSGYYLQKHYPEKQQQHQQGAGSASNSTKGPLQSNLHNQQFQTQSSGSFSYVHTAPAGVQVKPASEQKQPSGNREPLTRK